MRLAWLLFLATLPLSAQEIVITGLERPFNPPNFAVIRVSGIEDAELAKATVALNPPDPQIIIERSGSIPKAWIVLIGQDTVPGSRQFTVSLNAFRKHLDAAALNTQGMDPADAKTLVELAKSLSTKYPYRFGSAVLEVAGPRPPPKPSPTDPVDPPKPLPVDPSKVLRITYIFEKDQNPVPRPVSFALNQLNAGGSSSVVATEFEEDTKNSAGQTPTQYVLSLAAAQKAGLPALVVEQGGVILRVIKNPLTEKEVLDAAK